MLVGDAPSLSNIRRKWPTPFEKRRLPQIAAYNVSTIRDSEISSIMTNIKSTTGFPMSHNYILQLLSYFRNRWSYRHFKSGGFVCHSIVSYSVGDKPSLKGAWSGWRDQLYNFTPHEISSEQLKLLTSNFVHGLATRSTNRQITNCPQSMGVVRATWRILKFHIHTPWNISATSERRQIMCTCRLYQVLAFGRPTIPGKGVARVTRSISEFYTPLNFSVMAEDRIVKLCVRVGARSISLNSAAQGLAHTQPSQSQMLSSFKIYSYHSLRSKFHYKCSK